MHIFIPGLCLVAVKGVRQKLVWITGTKPLFSPGAAGRPGFGETLLRVGMRTSCYSAVGCLCQGHSSPRQPPAVCLGLWPGSCRRAAALDNVGIHALRQLPAAFLGQRGLNSELGVQTAQGCKQSFATSALPLSSGVPLQDRGRGLLSAWTVETSVQGNMWTFVACLA